MMMLTYDLLYLHTHRMEDGGWDLNAIAEEEFENQVTFLVPDSACDDTTTTNATAGANRAEQSLPRNLTLKPSQTHKDVSCVV